MEILSVNAMLLAREIHANQRRKFTHSPYAEHLAEVAGIVSTVSSNHPDARVTAAVAWLHDSMEDQNVTYLELLDLFGEAVANGVQLLSDLEVGNRASRKAASRERLSEAPGWVQDIKLADRISNMPSIIHYDPAFARTYVPESVLLIAVLTKAHPSLKAMARGIVEKA